MNNQWCVTGGIARILILDISCETVIKMLETLELDRFEVEIAQDFATAQDIIDRRYMDLILYNTRQEQIPQGIDTIPYTPHKKNRVLLHKSTAKQPLLTKCRKSLAGMIGKAK